MITYYSSHVTYWAELQLTYAVSEYNIKENDHTLLAETYVIIFFGSLVLFKLKLWATVGGNSIPQANCTSNPDLALRTLWV